MSKTISRVAIVAGAFIALFVAYQIYCRIVPPDDFVIAKKAYEYAAEGRGYNTFENFLEEGVRVKAGAHNKLTGVREYDVYFTNKSPNRPNSYGKTELVKFNITSCGRVLETNTMTMGDGPVLQGELLKPGK